MDQNRVTVKANPENILAGKDVLVNSRTGIATCLLSSYNILSNLSHEGYKAVDIFWGLKKKM